MIELLLLGIGSAVVSFLVFFVGLFVGASDSCGDGRPCTNLDTLAYFAGILSPWAFTAIALVLSVLQIARARLAFWIPLAALAVWALLQVLLLLVVGS